MTSLLLLAATPAPEPVEMELWEVTPGIEGFFWGFFVLAVLAIPLFLSMTRHMRRVDHNERLRRAAETSADVADDAAAGSASAPAAGSGERDATPQSLDTTPQSPDVSAQSPDDSAPRPADR